MLLVDETYRDLTHGSPLPMAATLSDRAISVSSMSKAYGLPGLRVGWAVCRDAALSETLLAAKEQMFICGATLDEAIAARVLADRARILAPILADVRARLAVVRDVDARVRTRSSGSSPRVVSSAWCGSRRTCEVDTGRFYDVLLARYGTYVGPGHWFEVDDRHFRLGFGWPTGAELRAGLSALERRRGRRDGVIRPD